MACAAALATLDVIDDEGLAARAERLGADVLGAISAMAMPVAPSPRSADEA